MDHSIGINRSARVFASTVALAAAFVSNNAISGPDVTVVNVPLPVTGSVSATVAGSVNANITNASIPVTGTVGVSSLPAVSLTIPAQPFFDEMTINVSGNGGSKGVGTGQRLAVTTLTISNFDGNLQQLFVTNASMSGPGCSGNIVGGSIPLAHLLVEPMKTVQLQFPTPMVFTNCVGAEVTTGLTGGSIAVGVVGYAVP